MALAKEFVSVPLDSRGYVQLRVGSLIVDPSIQRTTKPERVAEIAAGWDWHMAETPTGSRRESGEIVVIEGQNRVLALTSLDPGALIWVAVIDGLSRSDEAQLALGIYRKRKAHSAFQRWQLKLQSAEEGDHERAAERAVHSLSLRIGEGKSGSTICAVQTISTIIHSRRRTPDQGADLLRRTLAVIISAFTYDPDGRESRFDSDLLRAVSEVVGRNDHLEEARLKQALSSRPVRAWLVQVSTMRSAKWQLIGPAIVDAYNHGKRAHRISWE